MRESETTRAHPRALAAQGRSALTATILLISICTTTKVATLIFTCRIGAGNIDWPEMLRALKRVGHDHTITFEIFFEDRHFLAYRRDPLREAWDEFPKPLSSSASSPPDQNQLQ